MKIIQTKFTNIENDRTWYRELTQGQFESHKYLINTCQVPYFIESIKEREL